MIRNLLLLTLTALLASCHTCVRCNLGAPRWIKPTEAELTACNVPTGKRAKFDIIASYTKGAENFEAVRKTIQVGDLVAVRMTEKEKRDGVKHGSVKAVSYMVMKYAHMAIVVKDPKDPKVLCLYTSQGARGPNIEDGLDELELHTIDIYRLDLWKQLDMVRLNEFVVTSLKKKNKIFGYNFIGMVGIWSNYLEPKSPKDIGDDYLCSTAVAAALHYAGLDLDAVRCCEAFNMISPLRVVTSTGRMMVPEKMMVDERKVLYSEL